MIINKEEALIGLKKIISEFENDYRYIKSTYKEEDTKQKLIQPFFSLLGWDFTKDQDVRYERLAGKRGKVDYAFGNNHFYLEAKLNDSTIDDDILQANLYAYHNGRFCILTNFENFKLVKPIKPIKNKSNLALVDEFTLNYKNYIEKFDLI